KNTIHHFFSRLAIEIQRSLDGYMLALERRKVDRIFLCGGGSQHQGLTNYLTSTLAIPVSLFNPFEKIDTTQFPREQFIKKQALFAVCCGLAID
ncbi:MAG TPA: pilus assembly protein PilM, partial [bacterium]|nr:pilus assembly protein PilM [bacterium]